MDNRSPARLTRTERETRSPFLVSVQAEQEREIANGRRWMPLGIALMAIAMAINLIVIALFLIGRLM